MKLGRHLRAAAMIMATAVFSAALWSQSAVTIRVDASQPGALISEDFLGLSFETARVLPNPDGTYYFSAQNEHLVALFRTLGIRSLRIGGNTADRGTIAIPSHADIDNLFAFAQKAGVKVIYTFRLREGNPHQAAETAKYIMERHGADLKCFAIGNEPNVFAAEYPKYRDEWKRYAVLIASPAYAPDAKFCGPNATPGRSRWSKDFAEDFAEKGYIEFISQHAYPGGSGRNVKDQAAAREAMLSTRWIDSYADFSETFVPAVKAKGLTYRIEETNNFFHGGAEGVSDSFAAALWGLDFLYWWAFRGAAGLNFHTGDSVAAGDANNRCHYAVFTTSPKGYWVRPLGYAIKAFDLGSHGRTVPTVVVSNAGTKNVSAYGVLSDNGDLYVTLINKETRSVDGDTKVLLQGIDAFFDPEIVVLSAPGGSIAAASGITLAGAQISEDAAWEGKWKALPSESGNRQIVVELPAATAAVVRMRRQ